MNDEETFQRLCAGQIEGISTDEESSQLAALLKKNAEARRAYAAQMRIHAMLTWQHYPIPFPLPDTAGKAPDKIIRFAGWRSLTLAVAALVLLLCGLATWWVVIRGKSASTTAVASMGGAIPAAVLDTIQRQVAGGVVVSIERNDGFGLVYYTVAAKKGGAAETEFTVSEDGALLSRRTALASAPASVQKAVKAHLVQGNLEKLEESLADSQRTYVATIAARGGGTRDFIFNDDGSLAGIEMPLAKLPPPVLAAVRSRAAEIDWIEKAFENGMVTYAVAMVTRDGRQRHLTFREDGSLAAMQVIASEIPDPVNTAIRAQVGQGHFEEIEEMFDKGEIAYQVSALGPDGRWREVSFTGQGKPRHLPPPRHRRWRRPPPRRRPNFPIQQKPPEPRVQGSIDFPISSPRHSSPPL